MVEKLAELFDEEPKRVAGGKAKGLLAPPPSLGPRRSTLQAVGRALA